MNEKSRLGQSGARQGDFEYVVGKGWCIDGEPIQLRCRKCGLVEQRGVTWPEATPIERDGNGNLRFGEGHLTCPRDGCDSTDVDLTPRGRSVG